MKDSIHEIFREGKLKEMLCIQGGGLIPETKAAEIADYAAQCLHPVIEEGKEIPAEEVNRFQKYVQDICNRKAASRAIDILRTLEIVPSRYKCCTLCGEYYDPDRGHDCGFVRFLMGEQPEGVHISQRYPLDRGTAERIARIAADTFSETEKAGLTAGTEFYNKVKAEYSSVLEEKGAKCFDEHELAFQVISYLQEKPGLIQESIKMCKKCHRLFDFGIQGAHITKNATVWVYGKEFYAGREVKANFPEPAYGYYCEKCRPDNPVTAFLYHHQGCSSICTHVAVTMEEVMHRICPYAFGDHCPQCIPMNQCNVAICPLGRQAEAQSLYIKEIRWEAKDVEDVKDIIQNYKDYLIVPEAVYKERFDKDKIMSVIKRTLE